LFLRKEGLDVSFDGEGAGRGLVAAHDFPIGPTDKKLGEVPFDVLAENLVHGAFEETIAWSLVLEKGIERVGSRPVDFQLLKHWKIAASCTRKTFHLECRAGFLAAKLIARHGQNFKALARVLVVQNCESLVILGR